MKKWLWLLLGLLLISILTYVCFQNKAFGIKDDLISKAQTAYMGKNMQDLSFKIKGENLEQTRVLSLVGIVSTEEQKKEAEAIAEKIEGVYAVDNQLLVKLEVPSLLLLEPKAEVSNPKLSYSISGSKEKDGMVTLSGYVPNLAIHNNILAYAKNIFGTKKVIDELKEVEGMSKDWYESAKLGLEKLHFVEYGAYEIKDKNFTFEGYVRSMEEKDSLLLSFKNSLDSSYNSIYNISTPIVVAEKEVLNICQGEFKDILFQNKIHFSYNKSSIKKESYDLLNKLLAIAKKCPHEMIIIGGHTDSNGEERYNQELSARRANAVKKYFIKEGMDATRVESIGYGELHPITTNKTRVGRKQNRRIEIKIKGVE